MTGLKAWLELLSSLEFWITLLESYKDLGPLAPVFLAMIESFIPALPLVAIVAFNITAWGTVLGFLYSWLGSIIGCTLVFFFFRLLIKPHIKSWIYSTQVFKKALNWVSSIDGRILFLLIMMPFTPSVFVNMSVGLSDFKEKSFLLIMITAKAFMIGLLSLFGNSVALSLNDPRHLVSALIFLAILYFLSKYYSKKHGL